MEKIELVNGKYVSFETFEDLCDSVIYDNGLTEEQVVEFFHFTKDGLKQHFNSMISDGYSQFLFEGIDEILEEEVKKYLVMSN
jgi:hypothetical protein